MFRNIKKILVVRNDGLGGFLLSIPALRALKETYPQAELTLAVGPGLAELAGQVECVDQALEWEKIKKELRKPRFDLAVALSPAKQIHRELFLAGIPIRAGYNREWGFLLTHKIKDSRESGNRHEVEYTLDLAAILGASIKDKSLFIRVDENLYKYFINQDILIIHPFTGDLPGWPLERFADLAKRARLELGLKVMIIGRSRQVPEFDDTIINMVNKTTLVELAALLKRGMLLISSGSAPAHLAAAVGTPVIALFRSGFPAKSAKRWGPWGTGHVLIEKNDLNDVSVEEVLDAVRRQCGKEKQT